eukprot:477573_1
MRYSPLFLISNLNIWHAIAAEPLIVASVGNIWHAIAAEPLIHSQIFTAETTSIVLCTTAGEGDGKQQALRRNARVFISIGDVIYSIFVCWLFIRKLRGVIKLIDVN